MELSKHNKYLVTVEIDGQAFEIVVYLSPDLTQKEINEHINMQARKWLLTQSDVIGFERIDNE